jgi:thiamine biosynthesis lipoprotein
VLAAPLLPVAVIGFLILFNSRAYMGDAMPAGARRVAWNTVLVTSIVVMIGGAYVSIKPKVVDILKMMEGTPAAAAAPAPPALEESPEAPATARLHAEHAAMGTRFALTLVAPSPAFGTEEMRPAAEEAWLDLDALEGRISNWRTDSEVSRLNQSAAAGPVSVGPDVLSMLQAAKALHAATGGVFDPTVGPLLDLWGFYRKAGRLPADAELREALALVGLDKVRIDAVRGTVAFDREGMRLDFGGIGKGLALDRIAERLRAQGYHNALLDAGTSTVLALGAPPGEAGWTVDIRNPYTEKTAAVDRVLLRDEALSTSAAYENFLELDGRRYGHILDPRTGLPVDDRVLSATAIAPTAMESDALSTAFFALGLEGVRAYCAERPEVRAIMVVEELGHPKPVRINFTPNEEAA